jgi:hypothetical protein
MGQKLDYRTRRLMLLISIADLDKLIKRWPRKSLARKKQEHVDELIRLDAQHA